MGLFKKEKDNLSGCTIYESLFECRRGELTIRGTEYRPEGKHLPVAIVCHGFMAFQDTVRQYAKALAEQGYAAYCFDFCGGSVIKGQSDGKTTEMSVLTEAADLEAVLQFVTHLPYVDPTKILLLGCSQGGFVSALVAARQKEQISKLALFYPAFCIPDDARAGKMMFAKFDPADIPDIIRCGPMKLGRCYASDVIGMDPYELIQDFPGEVLILHGTKDQIVNPAYSQRAYDTYQASCPAGMLPEKRAKICFLKGGAHGFSKKHDKLAIEELLMFADF